VYGADSLNKLLAADSRPSIIPSATAFHLRLETSRDC
jgi:hypothetical protein